MRGPTITRPLQRHHAKHHKRFHDGHELEGDAGITLHGRRSSFERTEGYNTRINHCEDGDIFMQLVEHGKFYRIPHVLYARRSHADNVSRKNKHCRDCGERQVCNFMRVWSKHANYDPVTFTPLKK